ncbi:MAG: hypothetical protein ABFD07_19475 [Methanobacterium sp.]
MEPITIRSHNFNESWHIQKDIPDGKILWSNYTWYGVWEIEYIGDRVYLIFYYNIDSCDNTENKYFFTFEQAKNYCLEEHEKKINTLFNLYFKV